MELISGRTIERLCLYRRLLKIKLSEGTEFFYSHDLAEMAHVTSVQVRRDLMYIGYSGNNRKGYETKGVLTSITEIIDTEDGFKICLVGLGNLGKALIKFFSDKSDKLKITALFDVDPAVVGKKYNGILCHHSDELESVIRKEGIQIGIISSSGKSAKEIADIMVRSGITSVINYTSTPLNLPENTYLEEIDMTSSLERASYFAKRLSEKKYGGKTKKKLLIVDDDRDITAAYRAVFAKMGYVVISSLTAEEGLKTAEKEKPDIILLDIMMEQPDSGFLFLSELREKKLDIPVILSSSIAKATASIMDITQLNIKSILQKPVDIDDLVRTVEKYTR